MLAQLVQAPACCELLTIGRLQWLATRAEGSIPIRHGILKLLFFDLVKCSRLCVACGRRKRCMFRRLELCSTTESKTWHAILHLPISWSSLSKQVLPRELLPILLAPLAPPKCLHPAAHLGSPISCATLALFVF